MYNPENFRKERERLLAEIDANRTPGQKAEVPANSQGSD
jgi:hypothetical protein